MIKIFWTTLFLLTALIGAYFTFLFGKEFFDYTSYSHRIHAKILEWQVRELKNGKFAAAVRFSYQIQGRSFEGISLLKDRAYLNDNAALLAIKNKELMLEEAAWVNPKNPEKSTIQRKFPTNLFIRTLIIYGVLIYFYFLRSVILKKHFPLIN